MSEPKYQVVYCPSQYILAPYQSAIDWMAARGLKYAQTTPRHHPILVECYDHFGQKGFGNDGKAIVGLVHSKYRIAISGSSPTACAPAKEVLETPETIDWVIANDYNIGALRKRAQESAIDDLRARISELQAKLNELESTQTGLPR